MSLKTLFQAATHELRKRNVLFAVAGGFAADLYRHETRLTMDVDFVILTDTPGTETAVAVLEALHLKAGIARKADFDGGPLFAIRNRNTEPYMVVGRPPEAVPTAGVDILLPSIPWAKEAVTRAQANQVDFGFGPVPALTLEDVILSKLYCLKAALLRAKDLDDLQSIFSAGHKVDMPYLAGQMKQLMITIPIAAEPFLPESLLTISRDAQKKRRRKNSPKSKW